MRRLAAHFLLTPTGLEPGRVVTVADDGTILEIAVASGAALDGLSGVEFFGGILTPGFLNAHCHLELSHLRGAIPPGGGLTAFAKGMRAVRTAGKGSEPLGSCAADLPAPAGSGGVNPADAAGFWDSRMWAEGVNAVWDICNGDSTFDLKRGSRIKYYNFCELFSLGADPAKAFALRDRAIAMGLEAGATPHSTYSLNLENFAGVLHGPDADGEMKERVGRSVDGPGAGMQAPLSIHFLETGEERDLFKRRGPMWNWYEEQGLRPDFIGEDGKNGDHPTVDGRDGSHQAGYGGGNRTVASGRVMGGNEHRTVASRGGIGGGERCAVASGKGRGRRGYEGPAERLVGQVPADRPVVLVHNCALTQRDIDIVMGHFTAPVTWVVCPRSNGYISGLRPPLDLLRKNNLRIRIGTDSPASNDALSIAAEIAEIRRLQPEIPLAEILHWAAAESIEPGRKPGVVHIDENFAFHRKV